MILFFFKSMIQVSLVIFVFIHDYTVLMWLLVYADFFLNLRTSNFLWYHCALCFPTLLLLSVFFWWMLDELMVFSYTKTKPEGGCYFHVLFFFITQYHQNVCSVVTYWVPSQMITCFRHIGLCLCDVIIVIIIDLY